MNSVDNKTQYQKQLSEENALLLSILDGTSHETGDAFFRSLVKELSSVLDTEGALVADYLPEIKQLRPRAFWMSGDWLEPVAYDIAGTPCQDVIEKGELFQIPDHIVQFFPRNEFLQQFGLMSYTGKPFRDAQGDIIGHLAVFDSKPIPDEARFMALFEIFGARAAAEMRRIKAEESVREREAQLSRLIDGAMDGIVEFGPDYVIRLANHASLQMLQLADTGPIEGSLIQKWFTPESVGLIQRVMTDFAASAQGERKTWIAEGLTGIDASGAQIALEATLSQGGDEQHPSFTLIMRDVQALREAEQKIQSLQLETELLREELQSMTSDSEIVGSSQAIRAAMDKLKQVADTQATVLLQGETGVGKEVFAREIHRRSSRKDAKLVTVNCAAIPRDLVESEFFGHTRGAFTGATEARDGRFLIADGGTIFLDEVGELPLDLQSKLLRVLQQGEFEPVGSAQTQRVEVRVIAATNRRLRDAVARGEFREDLYYRLNVFPIEIPPLRERDEDILLLAEFFARSMAKKLGRRYKPIAAEYAERLALYRWPGNVRELQNIIEHAVITSQDDWLRPEVGLEQGQTAAATFSSGLASAPAPILTADEMRDQQRDNIQRALEACDWKISGPGSASRLLGIKPSTLRSQIKAMSIKIPTS